MYVCICHAVSDKDIQRAAAAGIRDLNALTRELQVAGRCGRCAECARECLRAACDGLPGAHAHECA